MADYVEITDLVTLGEAAAGSLVDVTVGFKSKASVTFTAMIVGVAEYPGLPPAAYIDGLAPHEYKVNIPPGGLYSCSGWFTMPPSNVTVRIYAYYYGADGLYHLDDEMTKVVKLTELVPAFSGFKITDYRAV